MNPGVGARIRRERTRLEPSGNSVVAMMVKASTASVDEDTESEANSVDQVMVNSRSATVRHEVPFVPRNTESGQAEGGVKVSARSLSKEV